jgi:hypothetical protein
MNREKRNYFISIKYFLKYYLFFLFPFLDNYIKMSTQKHFNIVCLNFLVVLIISNFICATSETSDHHNEYLHEWAVKVHDPDEADLIALETGFNNHGRVSIF